MSYFATVINDEKEKVQENNDEFSQFVSQFNSICPYEKYMILSIYLDNNNSEFRNIYETSVASHNKKLFKNIDFMDAGFDLTVPYNEDKNNVFGMTNCTASHVNKIDLQVKCAAQMCVLSGTSVVKTYNTGYYMYPRSSISKSCVRMANNVGIIDSGYRGRLLAMVDNVYEPVYNVSAYDRYFQICAPGLVPVIVRIVNTEAELGQPTVRGANGFGSSGGAGAR